MNTYATAVNRAIDAALATGEIPVGLPENIRAEVARQIGEGPYRRHERDTNDRMMGDAVRAALIHHLETRGEEWVLGVVSDAIVNHGIRRLNTPGNTDRLAEYNRLRGYADRIARLPERANEFEEIAA